MDILQHNWSQIGLFLAIQLLYLEISTVNSFAWHNPSQSHSRTAPTATHLITQRWHQSVPKWYPYTMWKRGKRKDDNIRDFARDSSVVFRKLHPTVSLRSKGLISKYRNFFEKTNRRRQMNMISKGGFLSQHALGYSGSVNAKAVKLYSRLRGKYGFGPVSFVSRKLGSNRKTLLASATQDLTHPKEQKKFKGTDTGAADIASFGPAVSSSFYSFGGFKPTAPNGGFSGGFFEVKSSPAKSKEMDVPRAVNGFGDGEFTSVASLDVPREETGSWGGDGFGVMDTSISSTSKGGSWGETVETGNNDGSLGADSFSDNTKDCDTILSKSCTGTSQCSCYGFYECSKQKCIPLKSTDSDDSPPDTGSMWHEGPVDLGLSKRKDPSEVIQIYMLPWKPEK